MANAHIVAYYQFLCRFAAFQHRQLAQLHWYTQAKIEENLNWRP